MSSSFHLLASARRGLGVAFLALVPIGQPVLAQTSLTPTVEAIGSDIAVLDEVLRLSDLFLVLREEGLAHGETLAADMFPSGGGAGWATAQERIYDVAALHGRFVAVLERELSGDPNLPEILSFFGSDLGIRVVGLEIDARRAIIDDAIEDAARVAADRRRMGRDARQDQLERFIAAGDLLEMNVAGALTGNLAFLTGMNDSGAYGGAMPQDQILSDVWAQEAQVRGDTESWLHAYLGLAYQPLSEAELDRYVAFWESTPGKRLNAALFLAFDEVFRQVSYDLGHAAGLALLGQDI